MPEAKKVNLYVGWCSDCGDRAYYRLNVELTPGCILDWREDCPICRAPRNRFVTVCSEFRESLVLPNTCLSAG